MARQRLPQVTVITTGGTIACRIDPATGAAIPVVSGDELVALLPGVERIARLTVRELSLIPSWSFTPTFMHAIARNVTTELERGSDGVVITQGTDTLEESAYWLDLTVDLARYHRPVVVTGAMRNNSEVGADGPRNLLDAITVAAAPKAIYPTPVVVANSQLHAARHVVKTDSFSPATFQSPGHGPAGHIVDGRVILTRHDVARRPVLVVDDSSSQVPLIKWAAGMDDLLLRACLDARVDGVVIEGSGLGHVHADALPVIGALIEQSIPVVMTTRCQTGPVLAQYGGAGGGKSLAALGVIRAGHLPGPKARLLLIAALGAGVPFQELASLFERERR